MSRTGDNESGGGSSSSDKASPPEQLLENLQDIHELLDEDAIPMLDDTVDDPSAHEALPVGLDDEKVHRLLGDRWNDVIANAVHDALGTSNPNDESKLDGLANQLEPRVHAIVQASLSALLDAHAEELQRSVGEALREEIIRHLNQDQTD